VANVKVYIHELVAATGHNRAALNPLHTGKIL